MRELEEARVHEELSAREELEAHKLTLDKAKKELARNDEEMEKIKQADQSKHEQNEAALAKLKQEYEHAEELIRYAIHATKATHLDDEDRVHELDDELHRLQKGEAERIRLKEGEDSETRSVSVMPASAATRLVIIPNTGISSRSFKSTSSGFTSITFS